MLVRDIPDLSDSTELLDRPDALRERWETDGCLFFRDVIDRGALSAVRSEYMSRLESQGLVARGTAEPVWTGEPLAGAKAIERMDESVWRGLVAHPSFESLARRVIGESFTWLPVVSYRTQLPVQSVADQDLFGNRHADYTVNRIEFKIFWVPLMDIGEDLGGLTVAPGTHRDRALMEANGIIPEGLIPDTAWRRSDYRVGDVLVLHHRLAHAGLRNGSDRIRLSIDVRAVAASSPQPVVGTITAIAAGRLRIRTAAGDSVEVGYDDETMIRGIPGLPLPRNQHSEVLHEGSVVIAALNRAGRADVVRSAVV